MELAKSQSLATLLLKMAASLSALVLWKLSMNTLGRLASPRWKFSLRIPLN